MLTKQAPESTLFKGLNISELHICELNAKMNELTRWVARYGGNNAPATTRVWKQIAGLATELATRWEVEAQS